nr:BMC domain-containing protein [Tepidanaerobacter sp. GT38]
MGIIETYGLTCAIEAADTALKAANVMLIGYELARGSGLTTVKIMGDVGSVKAAISAADASASKIGKVAAVHIIPRPHDDIEILMRSEKPLETKSDEPKSEVDQSPEKNGQQDVQQIPQKDEDPEQKYTCNLCKDPKCPRKKGEPRTNCIHYKKEDA